jgi:hypothetical protein
MSAELAGVRAAFAMPHCGNGAEGRSRGLSRERRVRQDWMKASRSALIVAACVVGMPCGNPW